MIVLDETPYQEPKEALQVAPTGIVKASAMAAAKLPVDFAAATTLVAGGLESLVFGTDNLFKGYDEVYKPIQDRLTPEPGSVTTAGRFISGIAGFAPALLLGPAGVPVLAATNAIDTGAGLVEQGVGPKTATGAAMLSGAASTAMAGLPAGADTWTKTLALAALNPVIGAASTQAEKSLLEATGNEKVAAEYNPFDPVARGIDSVLGVAFGAMGKYSKARTEMLTRTKDSIDTIANWQKMFKDTPFDTTDYRTADLGYKAMQKALADISEGNPVDLSNVLPDQVPLQKEAAPVRAEQAEAKKVIAESLANDAQIQEHRIDADLRGHVQELVNSGDFNAVLDLVYMDPLTKTYNQKGWKRLERSGKLEDLAQGKSDLKKFKYLNDTYSDAFGDEVIAKSGEFLAEQKNVKVFRIGGDETAVVSTRNNKQDVIDAYENANKKLQEHTFTGTKKDGIIVDIKGVDLVYGTGNSPSESAADRSANKQRLIDSGQYSTGRGDKSLNLVERPREVRPDVSGARPEPSAEVKPADEVKPVTPVPTKEATTAPATPKNPAGRTFSHDDISVIEGALNNIRSGTSENYTFQTKDGAGNPTGEVVKGNRSWSSAQSMNPWLEGRSPNKASEILDKAMRGSWPKENAKAQWQVIYDALDNYHEANNRAQDAVLWSDPVVSRVENNLLDQGDIRIATGTDALGAPTSVSAVDFIKQAKEEYRKVASREDIYKRISDCL
jgi:diguanylate cyclase (GGDEF)-like protein